MKRIMRRDRVAVVAVLARAFELYHQMMMYSRVLSVTYNYESAEKLSSLLSSLLKRECKPEEFMPNYDESAEKSIVFYEQLKEVLSCGIIDKEAGLAFCKAMEHYNKGWCWLNSDGYLYMPSYCDNLLGYLTGYITKERLENKFVYFKLWENGKAIKSNFCLVRSTFRQIEELYYDIVCKREIRMMKKIKKG